LRKVRFFNLSRFKISICIWWCFLCSGSNIWDNRMSFCTVLLESTVIKFLLVNKEIKVFPGKVELWMRSISYSKMNTLLFSVFLLFVLTEMYSFVENEKYVCLGEDWTICVSFTINTMIWVFYFGCVFSFWPWYVFAFFWWKEWQVLDGVAVLGHFQHCSVMRLSCLDELVNN
jgi:hypothetical protein